MCNIKHLRIHLERLTKYTVVHRGPATIACSHIFNPFQKSASSGFLDLSRARCKVLFKTTSRQLSASLMDHLLVVQLIARLLHLEKYFGCCFSPCSRMSVSSSCESSCASSAAVAQVELTARPPPPPRPPPSLPPPPRSPVDATTQSPNFGPKLLHNLRYARRMKAISGNIRPKL